MIHYHGLPITPNSAQVATTVQKINSAAKDCPHCKGAGVVFDGHF